MDAPSQPLPSMQPCFQSPWLSGLRRTNSGIASAEARVADVTEVYLGLDAAGWGPGLHFDPRPELPLAPSTLDRILVKRNAQLVLQIEKQQNKFLQSLRAAKHFPPTQKERCSASSGVFASSEESAKKEAIPALAQIKEESSSTAAEGDSNAEANDTSAADMKEAECKDDECVNGSRRQTTSSRSSANSNRQLDPQTMSDLALFASGSDFREGNCVGNSQKSSGRRKYGSTSSEDYEEAKQVSHRKNASIGRLSRDFSPGDEDLPVVQRWMRRLAESKRYQALTATALAVNCVYIGVEVEHTAMNSDKDEETIRVFFVISWLFAMFFTAELIVNLAAYGAYKFVWGRDWHWNWLDTFVVITCLTDIMMETLLTSSSSANLNTSQLRVLRVLRLVRLARVVRIMRLVKALRALRTLCHSIICTIRSLVWAMILIILIVYVFSIVFTTVVNTHLSDHPSPWSADSKEAVLHETFGTLHRSIHSLFRSISGGLTWNVAADALAEISWFWAYLFTSYVSFLLFAVLNVMTGVFCHAAIESAQRDKEMAVQNVVMNRQRFESMLMDLFHQIDEDGSGKITISEFEGHFQDEAVKFLLHGLELEVEDAWTLFNLLDQDGDHDIDAGEFLDGCMHLKGNAKALEVAKLKRKTEAGIKSIMTSLEGLEADHKRTTSELTRAIQHVSALVQTRGEFSES
eukprot:TRINITY_DN31298_c0_g1_i1.p1 TRINITY_DN31298_c0_g1~~TRINITY_DN31298_c0_g1_i1.p1  ORF type:complete len:723 (-),score=94.30 TRINITY_DN31298_c0_g1_i1:122-2191(-)